ncbi:hypothetical protein CRG98_016540 [Punica granatum]|uniref:Uncharacterized protein n=1 Tax=Punica granatum TaxID=22663 RepID=A0A2I0K3G0_PUNGR|nr:hypothetical protein CRG98_016540 [Punica granatum]
MAEGSAKGSTWPNPPRPSLASYDRQATNSALNAHPFFFNFFSAVALFPLNPITGSFTLTATSPSSWPQPVLNIQDPSHQLSPFPLGCVVSYCCLGFPELLFIGSELPRAPYRVFYRSTTSPLGSLSMSVVDQPLWCPWITLFQLGIEGIPRLPNFGLREDTVHIGSNASTIDHRVQHPNTLSARDLSVVWGQISSHRFDPSSIQAEDDSGQDVEMRLDNHPGARSIP